MIVDISKERLCVGWLTEKEKKVVARNSEAVAAAAAAAARRQQTVLTGCGWVAG